MKYVCILCGKTVEAERLTGPERWQMYHGVYVCDTRDGLRIELITGEFRDVKFPKGVNVDEFFEELSTSNLRSWTSKVSSRNSPTQAR